MNVSLYQVYGQRTASNPNARNWTKFPLPSPRLGTRKARRAMAAMARKTDYAATIRGAA